MLANESIVPAISLIRLPIRHPPSFRARHALDRCHAWNERERAKWRRDTPSGGKKRKREEEGKWNGESQARVEKLETDTEDSDELILELARAGQIRQNCGERDEIPSGQGVDQLSFFFLFFFFVSFRPIFPRIERIVSRYKLICKFSIPRRFPLASRLFSIKR